MLDGMKSVARRLPFVTKTWRDWKLARYRKVDPQPTPYGFRLTGHAEMMAGRFEPAETVLVRSLLAGCDRFVNIGANIGYYVCHAIAAGLPVLAVEPLYANLEYLLRNVRANPTDREVEVIPVALSDRVGVVELFGTGTAASLLPGWAAAPDAPSQLAPVTTLDHLLEGRFGAERLLFLIDVEGVEKQVLDGAARTLARTPAPVFMIEISFGEHQGGHNPHLLDTFERFWAMDYRAQTADMARRPVDRETIERIAAGGRNDLKTQNFLFVREPIDRIPPATAD
jgi:FkbM family methyltransferase